MRRLILSMYIMRNESEVFISIQHIDKNWWKTLWKRSITYNNFSLTVTPSFISPTKSSFYLSTSPDMTHGNLEYFIYSNDNNIEYVNNLIMVIAKAAFHILKVRFISENTT